MQLHILLMILGLLFVADGEWAIDAPPTAWRVLLVALGPYVPLALIGWAMSRLALRRLRTHAHRASTVLNRLHRGLTLVRWGVLVAFLASLFVVGWRQWVVAHLGDWILVTDALLLLPPVMVFVFLWWAQYPIDRRLREQALIRHLDEGEPIFSFHTRSQFIMEQIRHQLLLVLVPMLVIVTWVQATERYVPLDTVGETGYVAIVAGGGLLVFILAPIMIRYLWRTQPMSAGSLRERLLDMCRLHHVRVRELLLWRTYGGLINGAVVGLFAPVRYILLTDGLIDQLDEAHVEAVMAHELGHVRRRHMPWLAICALATLGGMMLLLEGLLLAGDASGITSGMVDLLAVGGNGGTRMQIITLAVALFAAMVLWAGGFGFISRRFERQADTFAVQHLTRTQDSDVITEQAVHTMSEALRAVCRLNHYPTSRKSWRHGSIDWRVDYLRTLVGRPVDQCTIDRHVKLICWGCAVLFITTIALQGF